MPPRLLVAAVALVAVASGCDDSPRLVDLDPGSSFGVTMPNTTADRPYTFGSVPLCLDRPGRIKLLDVQIFRPRSLSVEAFATRDRSTLGNSYRHLDDTRFDLSSRTVDATCTGAGDRLGLEFQRHGQHSGTGEAIDLLYRSGGNTHTHRIRFRVALCAPGDRRTGSCRGAARNSDPDPHSAGH